jgi:hypothetical protein
MVQHPKTFSTHRDVVVTSVIFTHYHLKVNLRLLRSTGCVARILVLLERGHRIDASLMSAINDTGAELLFSDINVFARRADQHPHTCMNALNSMVRYEWLYPWLSEHVSEIDRVILYDGLDTFFQADPFRPLVAVHGMLLSDEELLLEQIDHRIFGGRSWIKRCFHDRPSREIAQVERGIGLCCGVIGGPATVFLKFMNFIMTGPYWGSCFVDQAIINYFFHNGTFRDSAIPITIRSHETILHTTFYGWVKIPAPDSPDMFDMAFNQREAPAIVHGCKIGVCMENFYRRCGYPKVEIPNKRKQWRPGRPFRRS